MTEYEDMSPWAVHFVRPSASSLNPDGEESGYHSVMSILYEGRVDPVAEAHGVAGEIAGLRDRNRPACFSEIPLHLLARLAGSRSEYGIGFSQRFLRSKGGARLWYVEDDSDAAAALRELVARQSSGGIDPDDPLWRIAPFIDLATTRTSFGDYPWEREWRVPGGLDFTPRDVAFLFIPEELHERALRYFTDIEVENSGPAYLCPYIDVRWDRAKIARKLAEIPARVDPSPEAVARRMGLDRI
ncbi:MAG TPA: hypothetical protein VGI73_07250 [Solirubrobacterales bacterium]